MFLIAYFHLKAKLMKINDIFPYIYIKECSTQKKVTDWQTSGCAYWAVKQQDSPCRT
jgi:hypothetical protein